MAYDHELYLKNCRKMIALNQEQVDESMNIFHLEKDPQARKQLSIEIQGWIRWVNVWKDRLDAALKNGK